MRSRVFQRLRELKTYLNSYRMRFAVTHRVQAGHSPIFVLYACK